MGKLIVFSAPSGSGKTTIVRELLKDINNLEFSISATSRKNRENEVDGKDYYFLSLKEFKSNIEDENFIEFEEVYENQFYGTLKSEIDRIWSIGKHVIFDVDVVGGLNIKEMYGDQALSFFVKAPSITELENRLRSRGTDSEESIQKRLAKAEQEMTYADQFDKIIVNEDLELAVTEVEKLVVEFLN